MNTIRVSLVVLMVLVATTAVGPPAAACSCIPASAAEKVEGASVAFVGTLVDKRPKLPVPWDRWDDTIYVFEVEAVFKGELPERIGISSNRFGPACGIGSPVGARIGLVAHGPVDGLSAGGCDFVEPDELLALADPNPADPGRAGIGPQWWEWVVAAGAAGFMFQLLWSRRARAD